MLTRVTGERRLCMCVCPHDRTKTDETTITKLATGIVHHEFYCPVYIRSKVKVTGSQSAKHIESDQVASVSLHSVEWPASNYV